MSDNFILNQHGGNTNIDRNILKYSMTKWGVKSMLDIGCGTGGQVEAARELGLDAHGIDGSGQFPDKEYFHKVNYENSPSSLKGPFDLGWSVEFVEHVPEECIDIFMKDFKKCKIVIVTGAPPGWGGLGHVNEQTEEYWVEKFTSYGFTYNYDKTLEIRRNSEITYKDKVRSGRKQFVRNRGLVFDNPTL